MSKVKGNSEKELISLPQQVTEALNGAAKLLGVAVGELWSIFVRQYYVRGINLAFLGISTLGLSYYLKQYIGLWWLVGCLAAKVLIYFAIQYRGNPKYYAIQDITTKVKEFSNSADKKSSNSFDKIIRL